MSEENEPEEFPVDINKKFQVSKGMRVFVNFLLLLGVTAINMCISSFATCKAEIREYLNITEFTLSLFSTVYFLGSFCSTIFLMFVFRDPNRKTVVLTSLFVAGGLLFLYRLIYNPIILLPAQFLIGVCATAINVYMVIWTCDFGLFYYKTFCLSLIILFRTFGGTLSIIINYANSKANFGNTFLVQSLFCLILGFIFIFVDKFYFSSRVYLFKAKTKDDQLLIWRSKNTQDDIREDCGQNSLFRYRKSDTSTAQMTLLEIIIGALNGRVYFWSLFSSTFLSLATIGLSFQIFDYYNASYQYNVEYDKLWPKIIITLGAPLASSLLTLCISLVLGGYHHKKTCWIMLTFYLLATISGNILPYFLDVKKTCFSTTLILTSIYYLCVSAITPFTQGTNFSAGTPSRKPYGILLATQVGYVFGATPGPLLFNRLLSFCNNDKTVALKHWMKLLFVGLFFNIIMVCYKLDVIEKLEKKLEEEEKELQDIDKN